MEVTYPHVRTPLLPHQIELVGAMRAHRLRMRQGFLCDGQHVRGNLGIVTEPRGSGKTLAALAYLSLPRIPRPATGLLHIHSCPTFSSYSVVQDSSSVHVIIVPSYLLDQWSNELERHMYPSFRYVVIHNRRLLRTVSLRSVDCILTTHRMWHQVYTHTQQQQIAWNQLIIDEAPSIYLSPTEGLPNFDFLWLLGSEWPTRCQDTEASAFYKSLVPWHHPLQRLSILRTQTLIPYPSLKESEILCKQQYTLLTIPSSILGTNYSGLVHDVIPNLFQALNLRPKTIEDIKRVCGRATLLDSKRGDDCGICLESPHTPTLLPCCMGLFCGACILRQLLVGGCCPLCRTLLVLSDLYPIQQESDPSQPVLVTKQQACLDYIEAHKEPCIVYVAYENIAYQIIPLLVAKGISCGIMDQPKTIHSFQSGQIRVLFVSSIALLRGITLSQADHLLFFSEPPSSELEQVLIHSIRRLGSQGPKHLVRLKQEGPGCP